jgi:hypothetical protein
LTEIKEEDFVGVKAPEGFGRGMETKVTEMDKRGVFMLVASHLHEHPGQSIAYARINGIAPPWSASEGAPAAKSSGN